MTRVHDSISWQKEADVVIVGYGGAGAISAITAHDAGANVLILEKMPKGKEGGNTITSVGTVFAPVDVEAAIEYFRALSCGTVDEEIVQVTARGMVKNYDTLVELGADPKGLVKRPSGEFPQLPGSQKCTASYNTPGNGPALFALLSGHVARRKIEVLYQTPGKELIQGSHGEILGVMAEANGQDFPIRAKRAVILTCGGFLFDFQMQKNYLAAWPFYCFGTPGNTGDGIRMAQKVGADLWHMANVAGPYYPAFKAPEIQTPFLINMPGNGYIFLDKQGRRFMNERKESRHGKGWQEILFFDGLRAEFPRIPWFILFDDRTRKGGPLVKKDRVLIASEVKIPVTDTWNMIVEGFPWSQDNSAEIAKGWVTRGETIAQLADRLKMEPPILEESLLQYNRSCAQKLDPQFQRPANTLEPIAIPPFYAIPVYPGAMNSQGGPRRNARAQIVDPRGTPIPRLYGAGECGSVWGFLYQGSGNLGECVTFGRIAGQNAAAEKPWG